MEHIETPRLDAALDYANRGFKILPLWGIVDGRCSCGKCPPNSRRAGKHPIFSGGALRATNDRRQIAVWFRIYPTANIGLPLEINNLIAIDVDPDGFDKWRHVCNECPDLTHTLIAKTGRGYHFIYRSPSGLPIPSSSTNAMGKGIDFRGSGGHIVVPPSTHFSGTEYTWHTPLDQLRQAPGLLVDWIRQHSNGDSAHSSNALVQNGETDLAYMQEDTWEILSQLGSDWYDDRDRWIRVAFALKWRFSSAPDMGWALFDRWSSQSARYNQEENLLQWRSIRPSNNPLTLGSIIKEAGLEQPKLSRILDVQWNLSDGQFAASDKSSVLSATDLLNDTRVLPPDLIDGLVPSNATVLFSGHGGVGKSYILLDLCLVAAMGKAWLGHSAANPVSCLIIDLENNPLRVRDRLQAILRGRDLEPSDLKGIPLYFTYFFPYTLADPDFAERLAEIAGITGAQLVVLDSLADFLGGADENSNSEMALAARQLRRASALASATILVQHHVAKAVAGSAQQTARGASALFDDVEISFQITRKNDRMYLRQDKNRLAREIAMSVDLAWDQNSSGDLIFQIFAGETLDASSAQPDRDSDETAILSALSDGQPHPQPEISANVISATGHSRATIFRKIRGLTRDLVVTQTKPDSSGTTYLQLAEKGRLQDADDDNNPYML